LLSVSIICFQYKFKKKNPFVLNSTALLSQSNMIFKKILFFSTKAPKVQL
jgi:hypothetical protein